MAIRCPRGTPATFIRDLARRGHEVLVHPHDWAAVQELAAAEQLEEARLAQDTHDARRVRRDGCGDDGDQSGR